MTQRKVELRRFLECLFGLFGNLCGKKIVLQKRNPAGAGFPRNRCEAESGGNNVGGRGTFRRLLNLETHLLAFG